MIKSILTSTAIILASTSSAFAGPMIAVKSIQTIYGQFSCLQRAQNKLTAISATSMTANSSFVWGHYPKTTMGVWCRGQEAIIMVSGENADDIRDEIVSAF